MRATIGAAARALQDWIDGPASLIGERWESMRPGARVAVELGGNGHVLTVRGGRRGPVQEFTLPIDDMDDPAASRRIAQVLMGRGVSLAVPASWLIARRIELPLEAAGHLDGIVASRISSLSPLPASETVHGHRVAKVDRDARRMEVAIAILPRARLNDALAAMEAAGARDVALEVDIAGGEPVRIDPRRVRGAGARSRIRAGLLTLLAVFVGGAIIAVATGYHRSTLQAEARAALERRAEAARLVIADASAPEAADTAPKQAALDIKNDAISVVGALEDLAIALPRHSFATEIVFADGRLRLTGRTMDLPDALTELESSGRFADSRPIGALTREQGGVFADFVLETRPLARTGGMLR